MRNPATIHDVAAAGWTIQLASGSVETEQQALADARGAAAPHTVREDADRIADEIARAAVAQGAGGPALAGIVARATRAAVDQVQAARDDRVRFHERALDAARSSPDVWFVSWLGDPDTPDDDVRLYVACSSDGTGWDEGEQEKLDQLAAGLPE